jgi:hypothetical protein
MTAKKRRIVDAGDGLCVYCGEAPATTDDHAPPKGLFPRPRPSDLITVRSCNDCNCGDGEDDDYFRFVLTAVAHTENSAAMAVLQSVARALRRPEAAGFRTALHESIQFPSNYRPSGDYEGPPPMGHIDLKRMKRVANRILKAYFFMHTGRRIPKAYEVITYVHDEMYFFSPSIPKFFSQTLEEAREDMIGDGSVFRYCVAFPKSDHPDTSVWWFLYYDAYIIRHIVRRPPPPRPTIGTASPTGKRLLIVPAQEAASPRVRKKKDPETRGTE